MRKVARHIVLREAGLRKHAFEISTKSKGWEDSPALMGGVAAGTLGTGALAAGGGLEYLTRKFDVLEPGVLEKALAFRNLDQEVSDPTEFLARYTDLGSDLARNPAVRLPSGEVLTGRGIVERVRSGDLGKIFQSAGVVNAFDPDSIRHYDEFSKGPAHAAREMFRETFPGDPVQDFKADVLGRRYHAIKDVSDAWIPGQGAGLDRNALIRERLREGATPGMADVYEDLDTRMATRDPETYDEVTRVIREGGDPTDAQNRLMAPHLPDGDPLRGHLAEILRHEGVPANVLGDVPDAERMRILRKIYSPGDDASRRWALARMNDVYRRNLGGYQRLIDPLAKAELLRRTLQKGGRGLVGLGALGLGAGAVLGAKGMSDVDDVTGFRVEM